MRRFCLLAGGLALAALPAVLRGAPEDPAAGSSTRVEVKDAATASAPAKATTVAHPTPRVGSRLVQWAYVDPQTGRFTDKPVADAQAMKALRDELAAAAAAAPEVLEAMPSVTPGGGLLVQLDRRFASFLVATVGKDGKVTVRHEPVPRDPRGKE
jgi:hypothetical protein